MNIQEFAERILLGKTLSEKLGHPGDFEDLGRTHQKIALPDFPNRPPGLSLNKWHQSKRVHFPKASSLEDEKQRGIVLHFFANHELLALELIALALLKFPEAPSKFRRGLINILLEEQTHMQLYERRMREYGVEFGEIPVNDFFWKCLSKMQTPQDFVTGMSLTLEQANLDYGQHYAAVFRQIGDLETATILEKVYQDEIGHVRHGLQWFNRWKPEEQNDWEAYKDSLLFPLSPARAKGIGFDKEGRRHAGFSEHYISEIELYSQSKGREPGVFFFNPACESEVAFGKPGLTPSKLVAQLALDFTAIPVFLARQDDVVLVKKKPSIPFLSKLQKAGFSLPELIEFQPGRKKNSFEKPEFAQRKINSLQPWGWSPDSAHLLSPLRKNISSAVASSTGWNPRLRPLFSKDWSAAVLANFLKNSHLDPHWGCESKIVGRACHVFSEIEKQAEALRNQGFAHLVLKAAFGSSGQNMVHLFTKESQSDKRNWIENILKKQGTVVIEPWLEKALDLSLQFDLQPDGSFSILGATRFFTDPRGQYRGSIVGRFDAGLNKDLLKFLHHHPLRNQPKPLPQLFRQIVAQIAPRLSEAGYAGPVSVDTLIYQNPGKPSFHFKPIVEINPRFSMGRLSLELAKHLQHRRLGVWLILNAKEIQARGFANIAEFAQVLEKRFPLLTISSPVKKINNGVLFTTDPDQAENFISLLWVDQSLEACLNGLEKILDSEHPLFLNR